MWRPMRCRIAVVTKTQSGSRLACVFRLVLLQRQPEDETERCDDQRDRSAEREHVALSFPVHHLAQETDAELDNHDPDEVPFQVGQVVDFQPARQGDLVVDEELIEPESHDVEHRTQ